MFILPLPGKSCKSPAAGFTLLEVLVALCILTAGVLSLAAMQLTATRSNTLAARMTQANTLAQSKLEELMRLPPAASDLAQGTHTDPDPPPGTALSWTVTDGSPLSTTKEIQVTVTWTEKGITRTTQLRWIRAG